MNLGYYPAYCGLGRVICALRSFSSAQRTLAHKAIALMGLEEGHQVLDVACGRGGSSFMISQTTPGVTVDAIDLLEENIAIAKRIFPPAPGLTYHQGNAQQLAFADEQFDRALCCEAAFHFPSRRQFLQEAARVLKPGGRLVVVDFVWKSAQEREHLDHPQTRIVRDIWEWDDMATEDEYRSDARSAGLVMAKIEDWSRRVTIPLQKRMEFAVWMSRSPWRRRLMSRFMPLFTSMNDQDWDDLSISTDAHRFVTNRTQYKAYVFHKPAVIR